MLGLPGVERSSRLFSSVVSVRGDWAEAGHNSMSAEMGCNRDPPRFARPAIKPAFRSYLGIARITDTDLLAGVSPINVVWVGGLEC